MAINRKINENKNLIFIARANGGIDLNRWVTEDWGFEVEVTRGKAGHCRIGLEEGDRFAFEYGTPAGFCPKTMPLLYTWCEVIRCGGDFTLRGCEDRHSLSFSCADGCIGLRLTARPINRDDSGIAKPNGPRPED